MTTWHVARKYRAYSSGCAHSDRRPAYARKGQGAVVDAEGQWSTANDQRSMVNDECLRVNLHSRHTRILSHVSIRQTHFSLSVKLSHQFLCVVARAEVPCPPALLLESGCCSVSPVRRAVCCAAHAVMLLSQTANPMNFTGIEIVVWS